MDYYFSHPITTGSGSLSENISVTSTSTGQFSVAVTAKGGYDSVNDIGSLDMSVTLNGSSTSAAFAQLPPGVLPLSFSISAIKTKEALYIAITKVPPIVYRYIPQLSSVYQEGTWVQLPKMLQDLFVSSFMKGFNGARNKSLGIDTATSTLSFTDMINKGTGEIEKSWTTVCGNNVSFENWNNKSAGDKKAFAEGVDKCLDGAMTLSNPSSVNGVKTVTLSLDPQKYIALGNKLEKALCAADTNGLACDSYNKNISNPAYLDTLAALYKDMDYKITLGDSDLINGLHVSMVMNGNQIDALTKESQSLNSSNTTVAPSTLQAMSFSVDSSWDLNTPIKVSVPSNFISVEELAMKYAALTQGIQGTKKTSTAPKF